jgi:hypothetical protein
MKVDWKCSNCGCEEWLCVHPMRCANCRMAADKTVCDEHSWKEYSSLGGNRGRVCMTCFVTEPIQ